jgi:hypothetical protein
VNAADMHRVRQSLPYFKEYQWEVEVIAVDPLFIEVYSNDPLLLKTIPDNIPVHYVKAWNVGKTRKFGLGSLSMRSFFSIKKKGNELLKSKRFDLVYFSTTAFHVMALGPYWKKKYKTPFILDIQDPWRNDFYLDKPKSQRPPKFFISYSIDKYLEAKTIPKADGIISVSQGYCDTFQERYPGFKKQQCKVITFGASLLDFEVMRNNIQQVNKVQLDADKINIVYVGRGGHDMRFALEIIFKAFAKGVSEKSENFERVHIWFIGTSYAQEGTGRKTIMPIAESTGIADYVTEITDRIPYFETLFLLNKADVLLVPGSTDITYTASKIYPYILAQRPLLAVFHEKSSVVDVLTDIHFGHLLKFDHTKFSAEKYIDEFLLILKNLFKNIPEKADLEMNAFEPYTANAKTKNQVDFFNETLSRK